MAAAHAYLAGLVEAGLFPDEARGMVRTWSRSWFRSEGTRLVYIVPRALTDALLPIRITPRPEKLVRVLVGRLEYLTPEVERGVERALRDGDSERLAGLGRFLEPNVRRILDLTDDTAVRAAGEALLANVRH